MTDMINSDVIWVDSDIDLPGFDGDPATIYWETKTVKPDCHIYQLNSTGDLLRANTDFQEVPPDERPNPNAPQGSDDAMVGSFEQRIVEWVHMEPDGAIEFFAEIDGEDYLYEAQFDAGELVEIQRIEDRGIHEPTGNDHA